MASSANKVVEAAPPRQKSAGFDWGHLRFFLELARTQSLSAAVRRLGVDRNTVARRVVALEEELGIPLFERGPQGWICLDDLVRARRHGPPSRNGRVDTDITRTSAAEKGCAAEGRASVRGTGAPTRVLPSTRERYS